ncbi:MAG TPA: DNA topoisomerase IB [Urbifossiella sp.]|nr:DNA topoisomerase IB [Urbifossiella sp.]
MARLRHVSDSLPGYTRERFGNSFRYRDPSGKLVRCAAELERIRCIVIPPAWEKVWICLVPNGHLQATGRDARGRKQYRYHPDWTARTGGEKFDKLAAFGKALPGIRQRVQADLGRPGVPRETVLAAVVQLLDRTALRIGNSEYARSNGSYGLTTLLNRHVAIEGGKIQLRFRGKSGIWQERWVNDVRLARIVGRCRELPGQELFQYLRADGRPHAIGSTEVNSYIRRAGGGDFTAKDFRTWAGSVKALEFLALFPYPTSKAATERSVREVVDRVAGVLGNTPAVCRKSYIHPKVFDSFAQNALPTPSTRHRSGLSPPESRLLNLLAGRSGRPRS